MVLRALISQSFLTFLPVYYARQGYSLISIGTMVALFTVAGAVSGLLGGYIGDKIGYKPVFIVNFALMTPILFLFLNLTGKWIYPGVFLAGFFLLAAMTQASDAIKTKASSPDAEFKTLHIRCGTDLKSTLPAGGLSGDFLEYSDRYPRNQCPTPTP